MAGIKMNPDETLEIDTIIKEDSNAVDPISNITHRKEETDHIDDFIGFQTKTSVFDPPKPGLYDIKINGQDLTIKVINPNNMPNDGIIHNWLINEGSGSKVTDSEGSKIGDSKGCSWTSNTNISDYALSLDGNSDNWIDYGFSTKFEKGTFLFWFNPDSIESMPLFGNGGTGEQCRTNLRSAGTISFQRQSGGSSEVAVSSSTVSSNNWYMCAGWWDDTKNEIRVYIDGVRKGKSSYSAGQPGSTDGWRFGRQTRNASGEGRFTGKYDITSFYSEVPRVR
jgi:hypothetical protein